MPRYRAVLVCGDVPVAEGAQAALDISEELNRRPWHENVTCMWDGRSLVLTAENDFDERGLALSDEFSDLISACMKEAFDGDIRIVSVTKLA